MSGEEVECQIGAAVLAYSRSKVALALSEELLLRVAETYRRAGASLHDRIGSGFTSAEEALAAMGEPGMAIPDRARLEALLTEHGRLKIEVGATLAKLKRFGVDVV